MLRIAPPLTLTVAEAEEGAAILEAAVKHVVQAEQDVPPAETEANHA